MTAHSHNPQTRLPAPEHLGTYDIAVVGGGLAGLATAARIAAQGRSTIVLEAHSLPGGCAGWFRRCGFSFDVGATTLVNYEPDGVGGEFLDAIGMEMPEAEALPGYLAWLPDQLVVLHRDAEAWHRERLEAFGDTPAHRRFWKLLDTLAEVFWKASRDGIALPFRRPADVGRAMAILPWRHWHLSRYLFSTMGDALRDHGLSEDVALVGLLSCLVEDTVHASLDDAPLINAALGLTIRGAGLTRASGGMHGFVGALTRHLGELGARFERSCTVTEITGAEGQFLLETSKGQVGAAQVVSAIPASATAAIAPPEVGRRLERYLRRDADAMGGAIVVFIGVPEHEVSAQAWTHHQVMCDYDAPLGLGNNMFISVSAPGDTMSAPAGHRAVMISTHCELDDWMTLSAGEYEDRKAAIGDRLVEIARRVYPDLGREPKVFEVATPRTYARFARRPDGAVGGVRQTLRNTNLFAVPHDIGVKGFHLVGDSTWPGLGTVACALGSRTVARQVMAGPRSTFAAGATRPGRDYATSVRR